MAYSERELLARLIQCEAGGEGENGMKAVASVVMNRARVPYGEFSRISNGGDVRAIIEQPYQFTCLLTTENGAYNSQNVYNMNPEQIHYDIADWALAGNTFSPVGDALFFFNPYSDTCPQYFPSNGIGVLYNKINQHCFYGPSANYQYT